MVKRFLFPVVVCGLLVAATTSLAFMGSAFFMAGTPSAGGGSGAACDLGPNYTGPIPTAASDAGFTRCALNLDFTQTSSILSNPANWLNCSGTWSPSTILWYAYPGTPCSDYAITTDGGVQVFSETFTATDYAANRVITKSQSNAGDNTTTGNLFTPAEYVEIVTRIDNTSYTNMPLQFNGGNPFNLMWDFFSVGESPGNFGGGGAFPEDDWNENYHQSGSGVSAATGSQWTGCSAACARGFGNGGTLNYNNAAPTNYQTLGARRTQNGSGSVGMCNYQDANNAVATATRTRVGCTTGTWADNSTEGNARVSEQWWTGLFLNAGTNTCGSGTSSCSPSTPMTTYTQRITIWVCSAGNSTTNGCSGTINPAP